MWPLTNENRQQLDKKSKIIYLFFFREEFISKGIKAINYKMKNLNRFVHSSNGSPRELQISRLCLTSTKKRQIWRKSKIHLIFFCEKPVWKPVKSYRILLKHWILWHQSLLTPFLEMYWECIRSDLSLLKSEHQTNRGSNLFRPPVFFMTPSYKLYVVI